MGVRDLAVVLASLSALTCGFSPADGAFTCTDGRCPDGQVCDVDQVCRTRLLDFGLDAGLDDGPPDLGPLDGGPIDLGPDPSCLDPGTTRMPDVAYLAAAGTPGLGWTESATGMGTGELVLMDGAQGYLVAGIDGRYLWFFTLPTDLADDVLDGGWRLEFELQVAEGAQINTIFDDAERRFFPSLSLVDPEGPDPPELRVTLEGGGGTHVLATGEDARANHTHVVVREAGATVARYFFDGLCVGEVDEIGWEGSVATRESATVEFGNGSSRSPEGDGVAVYRSVLFTDLDD